MTVDVDEDGELTRDELLSALKLVGVSNIIDIDKVMAEADADGNGTIDIFEFMAYLTMNTSKMMGLVDTRANAPQRNAKAMADEVLRTQSEMSQSLVIGDDLWLVHPQSLFSSYWDVALSLVLLVTVILPLSLAFDLTPLAFNLSVDGLFFLDFVKNFVTGFVDEDEFVVMRFRSTTAVKYGRSWAVPDLIAFVPFYLLPHTDFFGSSNNVLKLFRLMRLGKVFRLLRASSLISQVNRFKQIIEDRLQIRVDEGIVALSKLSLTVIVSAHWMGCINWMICREFDFPEDSWVTSSGLELRPSRSSTTGASSRRSRRWSRSASRTARPSRARRASRARATRAARRRTGARSSDGSRRACERDGQGRERPVRGPHLERELDRVQPQHGPAHAPREGDAGERVHALEAAARRDPRQGAATTTA